MRDALWLLLPVAALALTVAFAVDYEREERRKYRARGTYAAQMQRLTVAFEEARRQIAEEMLPALRQATAAFDDFNKAWGNR